MAEKPDTTPPKPGIEKVFVKPGTAPDGTPFVVRHPKTMMPIAPEGELVELDKLTRRRLADGDLVRTETEWSGVTPADRRRSHAPDDLPEPTRKG